MLKGINKQILEVTSNDSPYFEKIIFFVRPEGHSCGEKRLQQEADRLAKDAKRPPRQRVSLKQRLSGAACILLGLAAGAALTVLMGVIG